MMDSGLLAGVAADDIKAAIAEVFPRWLIWQDSTGWHAKRRGNYRQFRDQKNGVYALHSAHPIVLVLQLDEQDRIPPPDGWDCPDPGDHLQVAAERDPADRARDEIARRIEASFPGWRVGHDLYGWTATRLDDPEKQVRGQSSQALTALLPFGG
jgi:hypothetical protein